LAIILSLRYPEDLLEEFFPEFPERMTSKKEETPRMAKKKELKNEHNARNK
jgi:hypothetical protein